VRPEVIIGELHNAVLTFVSNREAWAAPIVFILAFGESLAFISLLVPATAILFGVGALIGATGIRFWPIWLAAAAGASLGDWVSYWLGYHYKHAIAQFWPLSRRPALLPRGEAFFRKWGALGIFLGRFFGPLRSVVPLVAGICAMPLLPFQLANVASALVWAAGILTPGLFAFAWLL
jgi:membrane protein DedA with SNARE-associated domain